MHLRYHRRNERFFTRCLLQMGLMLFLLPMVPVQAAVDAGNAPPEPAIAGEVTIRENNNGYIVDEGHGISVEIAPETGVFRYTVTDQGKTRLIDLSRKKPAPPSEILQYAIALGDTALIRLWMHQFPATANQKVPVFHRMPLEYAFTCHGPWQHIPGITYDVQATVAALLDGGADPNIRSRGNESILHFATQHSTLDTVKCLVEHKADINAISKVGFTPRFTAVKTGHDEIADYLREKGGNLYVNVPPIHQAAAEGNVDAVAQILAQTPAARDATAGLEALTPLMYAACCGHKAVVALLLAKGAKPDATDRFGTTALAFAIDRGDDAITQLLLRHGAKIHLDMAVLSAVGWLTEGINDERLASHRFATIETLLQHGANVNVKGNSLQTPLIYAAIHKNTALADLLIKYGAKLDVQDDVGMTPLLWAICKQDKGFVELLVTHKADVNAINQNGISVLAFTSQYSQTGPGTIYDYLVKHGAVLDPPTPSKAKGK